MAADQFAMELPGSIKRLQAVIGEEVSIKSIKGNILNSEGKYTEWENAHG